MPIRVLLVDDTHMFRDGLKLVIAMQGDMEVIGEAADGAQGLAIAERERPDIILMDIRMPLMDGVEATRRLRRLVPDSQVLILTTYDDDEQIAEALKAGAAGYLLKDMYAQDLIQAIRAVHQGGLLILPRTAARIVAAQAQPSTTETGTADLRRVEDLTPRETEILTFVARGMTNREIADHLMLTEGTVKNHLSAVYSKLHARDRAQAIAMALRRGLVDR